MAYCLLCHQSIQPGEEVFAAAPMHASCVEEEHTGRPHFQSERPRGIFQTVSTTAARGSHTDWQAHGGPKAQIAAALKYIRERYDEEFPPGSPERERHRRVTRGEPE